MQHKRQYQQGVGEIQSRRTRLVRTYPIHTLEDAIAVPSAIQINNSGLPFDRVLLAKAMKTTPASSGFTTKLNSSTKYGLTTGGYKDERIELSVLGEKIVATKNPEERRLGLLEAALQPDEFCKFYEILDGKRLPEELSAKKLLETDIGVSARLTSECLTTIKANGLFVGILGEVGGSLYVSVNGLHGGSGIDQNEDLLNDQGSVSSTDIGAPDNKIAGTSIFIGHAGNSDVVDYLKVVLSSFEISHKTAECDFDVSRPLSAEVSKEMRTCTAGILIFAGPVDEKWFGRREEKRREKLNYFVGAVSVLYMEKIILIQEKQEEEDRVFAPGFQTLEFNRGKFEELGLPLITALHRMGIIEVTV